MIPMWNGTLLLSFCSRYPAQLLLLLLPLLLLPTPLLPPPPRRVAAPKHSAWTYRESERERKRKRKRDDSACVRLCAPHGSRRPGPMRMDGGCQTTGVEHARAARLLIVTCAYVSNPTVAKAMGAIETDARRAVVGGGWRRPSSSRGSTTGCLSAERRSSVAESQLRAAVLSHRTAPHTPAVYFW